MNAQEIIHRLEEPTDDRWPTMNRLTAEAPLAELIAALRENPRRLTRELLIDIIGKRYADPDIGSAVPDLIEALQDSSKGIRSSAAEALANFGDPRAGEALMAAFEREGPDEGMRCMYLAALGATRYRPALSALIQGIQDPDESIRQCAAWGLKKLVAPEAKDALRQALKQETYRFAAKEMRGALKAIREEGSQNA